MLNDVEGRKNSLRAWLGRRKYVFAAGIVAVGLVAAACGGDDDADAPTAPADTATATEPADDAATATTAPSEPTATAVSQPGPTDFTISALNTAFDTASLTIPAGEEVTVTFVNNDDSTPHSLHISGPGGFDEKTEIFVGTDGRSRDLVFIADEPGAYPFVCDVHASMTGTITAQ